MAAGISAVFVASPLSWLGHLSAANTARDGTGTLVTIATGGTNGSRIDRINVRASVTTTAGMVRFFIDTGSAIRLIHEIPVTAITPSGTVEAWSAEWVRDDNQPLVLLPSGWMLKASTHNAEAIEILACGGGDY